MVRIDETSKSQSQLIQSQSFRLDCQHKVSIFQHLVAVTKRSSVFSISRRLDALTHEQKRCLNAPGYVIHRQLTRDFVFTSGYFLPKMNLSVVFMTGKEGHEKSVTHRTSAVAFAQRSSVQECIGKHREIARRGASCCWNSIPQRALDVILYCAERGLPLRGHEEKFGNATLPCRSIECCCSVC